MPNPIIKRDNSTVVDNNPHYFKCARDGVGKKLDRFGYHSTRCTKGGLAIRHQNIIVYASVSLFRSTGLNVLREPTHVFTDIDPNDNRKPYFISLIHMGQKTNDCRYCINWWLDFHSSYIFSCGGYGLSPRLSNHLNLAKHSEGLVGVERH